MPDKRPSRSRKAPHYYGFGGTAGSASGTESDSESDIEKSDHLETNMMNSDALSVDQVLDESAFHVPSLGDEDFDLQPIAQTNEQISQNMMNMYSPSEVQPQFPPTNLNIPDINVSNSVMPSSESEPSYSFVQNIGQGGTEMNNHLQGSPVPGAMNPPVGTAPVSLRLTMSPQGTWVNKSNNQSPQSNQSSPTRDSSEDSEDSVPLAQLAVKRVEPLRITKKAKVGGKKKKKKDPNEPQKPVSAYALFFRDTQANIKGNNPNATFGEVSKVVASMWENLESSTKEEYKKRTEIAKKEYLKKLAAYRASMVSQQAPLEMARDEPMQYNVQQPAGMMPSPIREPVQSPVSMSDLSNSHSPPQMSPPMSSMAHISAQSNMSPPHLQTMGNPVMTIGSPNMAVGSPNINRQ